MGGPGLFDWIAETIEAGRRLVDAHIALAKTEVAAIGREIRLVAVAGIAILVVLAITGVLLPIALTLFLSDWLFGSMGWGILLGSEFSLLVIVLLVLAALRLTGARVGLGILLGVLVGVGVGVLFGTGIAHDAWVRLGDAQFSTIDETYRPVAAALVGGAAVLGAIGLLAGLLGGSFRRGFSWLIGGAALGAIIGAFTVLVVPVQVAAAIGVAVGFFIPTLVAATAFSRFDSDSFKDRFVPNATIQTARETVEWVNSIRPSSKRDKTS